MGNLDWLWKQQQKGRNFPLAASAVQEIFPSHLVTAVFRKITELMVLLPGICTAVILLGEGGKGQHGWPHTGRWAGKGQLRRERGPWGWAPPVLHHLLLQSRAMTQKWHCQLHSRVQWGQRAGLPGAGRLHILEWRREGLAPAGRFGA